MRLVFRDRKLDTKIQCALERFRNVAIKFRNNECGCSVYAACHHATEATATDFGLEQRYVALPQPFDPKLCPPRTIIDDPKLLSRFPHKRSDIIRRHPGCEL